LAAAATAFSADADIDARLQALYARVLAGEPDVQREIDSLIFVELLMRDAPTRARLLALGVPDLVERLRCGPAYSIQAANLPDLGAQIRTVVYLNGTAPPVSALPNQLLFHAIHEALPSIRRMKHVRHARMQHARPRACSRWTRP
jgi:hypothetical protein